MTKNKYIIAGAGTVLLTLLGTFYAWSLFRVYISQEFPGWTAAQLSLTFTLLVVVFCFGSLFSGWACGKLGRPRLLRISGVMMALGLGGLSFVRYFQSDAALVLLYGLYGVVCGFGVGIAYNVLLSGVSRWFPERSGAISGLLLMGYGLGSLVCGAAVSALADKMGIWNAFLAAGIAIGGLVFFSSFLFTQEPPTAKGSTGGETGITTGQMLKTPAFWFQFFWALFTGTVGLMVINSAAVIALAFGVAAALGLLVSLFNGFGRIVAGAVYDGTKDKSMFLVVAIAFAAGALLVGAWLSKSSALMFAGMLLAGMSYGSTMAVNAALIRDFFGMKHYGSNFAVVTMSGIPSSFLGPFVSGILQDAAGGDYLTTFYAMLVFAALGLACAIGVAATKKRIPEK